MFRWFKLTAPIAVVGGILLLKTGDSAWWRMFFGILLMAWGLAFVQVRDD